MADTENAEAEPIEGRWYMVSMDGSEWFPAFRDTKSSVSGWSNQDTWEDFRNEITHWVLIPVP